MLKPADGIKAVKRFVLECVFESGANPCPPVIVGIGLGGTSDAAAAMAKEASCFRKVGTTNSDPQVAQLERPDRRAHLQRAKRGLHRADLRPLLHPDHGAREVAQPAGTVHGLGHP
jgi:tartrate dehydratase alpha subunit/fumarate hydratase class I-like protein